MGFYYIQIDSAGIWSVKRCGDSCLESFGSDGAKQAEIIKRLGSSVRQTFYNDDPASYQESLNFAAILNGGVRVTPSQTEPQTSSENQLTKKVELTLGLYNPLNKLPNSSDVQNKVNSVTSVIGWNCTSCQATNSSVTLIFEASGTPILPLAAIIGAVLLCLTIGAVIISYNLKAVNLSQGEVDKLKEVSSQLKTNNDLSDKITEEYQAGQIQYADYISLLKEIVNAQASLSNSSSNVTSSSGSAGSGSGALGDITSLLMIAVVGGLAISLMKK